MRYYKIKSILLLLSFSLVFSGVSGFATVDKQTGKKTKHDVQETATKADKKVQKKKSVSKNDPAQDFGSKNYTENDFKPKVQEESTGWMLFKTFIILGLMVGGFYCFFRFVTKKTGIRLVGEDVIQVLSIVPIGQNRYLQVVDVAGKIMVLGVSENSINLITEITDREEKDRIRLMSSRSTPVVEGGFQEYFSKQIGRVAEIIKDKSLKGKVSERKVHMEDSEVELDYLIKQKNRLRNIDRGRNE